jgi:hypothetical protein
LIAKLSMFPPPYSEDYSVETNNKVARALPARGQLQYLSCVAKGFMVRGRVYFVWGRSVVNTAIRAVIFVIILAAAVAGIIWVYTPVSEEATAPAPAAEEMAPAAEPAAEPAPAAEPEAPAAEPEAPAAEPEAPAMEPEMPAAEPEAPASEPEAPATEPDSSTTP